MVAIFDLDQGGNCEQDNVGGGGVLVSQVTKDSAGGGGGGGGGCGRGRGIRASRSRRRLDGVGRSVGRS